MVLVLVGCGAGTAGLTPVGPPGQRMQLDGFSILPPQGEGWFVAEPSPSPGEAWRTVATFVRRAGDQPGAAIWATVTTAELGMPFQTPEQLVQQILQTRRAELQTGRLRLLEFRSGPGPGPGCHRYDAVTEDRGVPEFPGETFVVTLHHAICLHPSAPTVAVNLGYNERRRRGQPAADLAGEGEPFLRSLQFAPLNRPAVVAIVAVPGEPQGIAADARGVWVSGFSSNSVVRIDPRTSAVVKQYAVGMRPVGLDVGEGAVWVAANWADELWVIDTATDEVVRPPIRVGRAPLDVAVGAGGVWVTNKGSNTVSRIDPRTRQVVATIPVGAEPVGIAVGTTGVWVAGFRESQVWRIDPRTNRVAGAPLAVGQAPSEVVAGPRGVWVASQAASLSHIDEARSVVTNLALGQSASGVAVVGREVWATDYLAGVVRRMDPATGKVIDPPIRVGDGPVRLAVGHGAVWVTNAGSGTVSKITGF